MLVALALAAATFGPSSQARAQEAPVLTAQDDDFLPAFQPPISGNPLAKILAELDPAKQADFAALIAALPDEDRAALLDLFERFKLGHSGPNAEAMMAFDLPAQQGLIAFLKGMGAEGRPKMAYWLQLKGAGSLKGLIERLRAFSTDHALMVFASGNPDTLNAEDAVFWKYLNSAAKPVHAWGGARADTAPWQVQLSRSGASANSFGPREAALELKKYGRTLSRSQHNHVCGGVQIDAQWVLTAAHCVGWEPMANFTDNRVMRTGTLQLGSGGKVRRIVGGVVHPGFNEVTLRDDIALFRLADDDGAGAAATGIKLPTAKFPRLTNEPLWLTGFGKTGETDDFKDPLSRDGAPNTFSNSLLLARLRHVPSQQCTAYGAALFEKIGKRLPGQLCADSPDQADACQGDSGGPLFWRDTKGTAWLIGLVSFGKGRTCARSGLPGVYTDVQYYVRTGWIERAKKALKPGAVIKGG